MIAMKRQFCVGSIVFNLLHSERKRRGLNRILENLVQKYLNKFLRFSRYTSNL